MYDPVLLAQLDAVSGVDFNSYFVCLAAYQRGLTVTFHRNLADAQFAFQTTRGYNAELFSVSDGRTTHYFDRTIGDITDPTATVISKDKHQTKSVLQAAGIPTPDGIIFYKSQIKLVEKFLEQTRNSLYVLKPFNGSLARDVHIKLRAADVMTCIEQHPDERLILEQHIEGTELRVNIVADKSVGAHKRDEPNVIGDGTMTVQELIAEKNLLRSKNPVFATNLIPAPENFKEYLHEQGLSIDSVPAKGVKVFLGISRNRADGADIVDWTAELPQSAQETAIRAAKALNLPFCGIDLIIRHDDRKPFVLELNSRAAIAPYIYSLYGPGQGNAVAEAIIDMYFPKSVNNKRFPNAFIFIASILSILKTGLVSEITLPTLNADWEHKRIKLDQSFSEQVLQKIKQNLLHHGLYGQIFKLNQNQPYLDFCGPKSKIEEFMKNFTVKR